VLLDKGTVEALNIAYTATLRYYTMLLEKGKHEEKAERFLSKLWQKAGTRLRRYEPTFATRLKASIAFGRRRDLGDRNNSQSMGSSQLD